MVRSFGDPLVPAYCACALVRFRRLVEKHKYIYWSLRSK